jgi:hypothetical protein
MGPPPKIGKKYDFLAEEVDSDDNIRGGSRISS